MADKLSRPADDNQVIIDEDYYNNFSDVPTPEDVYFYIEMEVKANANAVSTRIRA